MEARIATRLFSVGLLFGLYATASLTTAAAPTKAPFTVAGTFVEGCSCSAPCPCQLTGVAMAATV